MYYNSRSDTEIDRKFDKVKLINITHLQNACGLEVPWIFAERKPRPGKAQYFCQSVLFPEGQNRTFWMGLLFL
jgi:hypothetical protein